MALWNYSIDNPGVWCPINAVRVDDGFGNLIQNTPEAFSAAVYFIANKEQGN
jgi:hypothetical protein